MNTTVQCTNCKGTGADPLWDLNFDNFKNCPKCHGEKSIDIEDIIYNFEYRISQLEKLIAEKKKDA